jgi:hypothetical protein
MLSEANYVFFIDANVIIKIEAIFDIDLPHDSFMLRPAVRKHCNKFIISAHFVSAAL